MFYVDTFAMEIVEEIKLYASPERYYEYRRGILEGVVIETYVVSHDPLKLLDFAHPVDDPLTAVSRQNHLEKNGVPQDAQLYAYTVPPEWYDEMTAKFNKEKSEGEPNEECQRDENGSK